MEKTINLKQKAMSLVLTLALTVTTFIAQPLAAMAATTGTASYSDTTPGATNVTATYTFTTVNPISTGEYLGLVDGGLTNLGVTPQSFITINGTLSGSQTVVLAANDATTTASGGNLGSPEPKSLVLQTSAPIPAGDTITITVTGVTNTNTTGTYAVYIGKSSTYTFPDPTWDLSTSGGDLGWSGVMHTVGTEAPVTPTAVGSIALSDPAVNATNVTATVAFTTNTLIPKDTFIALVAGGTNLSTATLADIATTGIPGGVTNIQSAPTVASAGGLGAVVPDSLVVQTLGDIPANTNVVFVISERTNVAIAATYSAYVSTSATYAGGDAPTWDLSTVDPNIAWSGVTENIIPTSGAISVEVEPTLEASIIFPTEVAKLAAAQTVDQPIGISVLTNATSFQVEMSATNLTKVSNGKTIPAIPGTTLTPMTFPTAGAGWGFAISSASDPTTKPAMMFDGTKFAGLTPAPAVIMSSNAPTGSVAKTMTVDLRISSDYAEAGLYTSTVTIKITPVYTN